MSEEITEVETREKEELKRALRERTAQLDALNREFEQFSHSVAHDLRAPLRALEGFSEIMVEDYGAQLDSEAKRCLDIISSSAKKASLLIEDLLAVSRLSCQNLSPAPVDMRDLILETAASLKPGWDRVEFKVGDLPQAWGDRALLGQVWFQLLSNALKFTRSRQQPIIQAGGHVDADYTAYFVRDNGVGFDMKQVHRLFGIFQRLHSDQEYEGRGVGLAVVQRIVRRHGGEVGAESAPQQGASFFFSLPLRRPAETSV
jgi:two-component system sensor kinase